MAYHPTFKGESRCLPRVNTTYKIIRNYESFTTPCAPNGSRPPHMTRPTGILPGYLIDSKKTKARSTLRGYNAVTRGHNLINPNYYGNPFVERAPNEYNHLYMVFLICDWSATRESLNVRTSSRQCLSTSQNSCVRIYPRERMYGSYFNSKEIVLKKSSISSRFILGSSVGNSVTSLNLGNTNQGPTIPHLPLTRCYSQDNSSNTLCRINYR